MNLAADILAVILLILGAVLSLAAGVALVRFPDLMSRMHAAAKPQVLGLLLVLGACALRLRDHAGVLVLVAVLQMATAPVAAHMVGRAGYRAGHVRRDLLVTDELADAPPPSPLMPLPAAETHRSRPARPPGWH
ncbi:monovalent cation/H(+) antiporter subunit G [Actinoplanes sp. GCM10030250]|uniref:monovalent cation/H(+) antiporter subunit G n=1 Tax=Actinoplanes sp. GCM10030250 TaxID=3273376 RepID=UPI00360BB7C6